MATEDLTTFTETDPDSRLTVTSTRVSAEPINLTNSGTTCLRKDYGASYFDALDIDFAGREANNDSGTGAYDMVSFTTAVVNNGYTGSGADDLHIGMNDDGGGGAQRIFFMRGSFTVYDSMNGGTIGNTYYMTLSRAASNATATLLIYSDSGRTTLVDTLVVTGTVAYRYLMPFNHTNQSPTSKQHDIYYENFDFNLTSPSSVGRGLTNSIVLNKRSLIS